MIKKIKIKNFKKFDNHEVELKPNGLSLVVGANNSGKSSFLHALSLWAFCCKLLIYEVGEDSLLHTAHRDGLGIGIDEFLPINIPSFKYLWPNQKSQGSYTLELICYWDDKHGNEKHLGFSLSLVTERLYIKKTDSNLLKGDHIPQVVYVPTFAGIDTKEEFHSHAIRAKLLGKGLSGSVIRNEILELYEENIKKRKELKGDKPKISKKDLANLRNHDPYELLQKELFEVYGLQLEPLHFNPAFNSYIAINTRKYNKVSNRLRPINDYKPRDLMVEGSGFLQWLSVYVYALSPRTDVLLLDEPDSHLHSSLQFDLFSRLKKIAEKLNKLILVATHSSEVIKIWNTDRILHVTNTSLKYLKDPISKVKVLHNLGNEYCPALDSLKRHKNFVFVENESDAEILKEFSKILDKVWPSNLCIWPIAAEHKERTQIYKALKNEIPDLKGISLHDRDTLSKNNVTISLKDKGYQDIVEPRTALYYRTWQRHELENYLFCPEAIARAASEKNGKPYADVLIEIINYLQGKEGIFYDGTSSYRSKIRQKQYDSYFDKDGHQVIDGLEKEFNISPFDIVKHFKPDEVFEDIITFIDELLSICK